MTWFIPEENEKHHEVEMLDNDKHSLNNAQEPPKYNLWLVCWHSVAISATYLLRSSGKLSTLHNLHSNTCNNSKWTSQLCRQIIYKAPQWGGSTVNTKLIMVVTRSSARRLSPACRHVFHGDRDVQVVNTEVTITTNKLVKCPGDSLDPKTIAKPCNQFGILAGNYQLS